MFIEMVEWLRCVRPHEAGWLVAGCEVMDERDVVAGRLGCPVCGTEYPIVEGVADFRLAAPGTPPGAPAARDATERAVRVAALLDLVEPGGFVVLAGDWGALAPMVRAMTDVHVLALDAPTDVPSGDGISLVRTAGVLPVRADAARGIALDASHAGPAMIESAVSALRPGARLVAPAEVTLPAGIDALAHDAHDWVGVKRPPPGPIVQLGIGRGR